MNNGYVSVPREFFDSIQWRRKRIFTESEAYLDLLQMAYYGSEPTERMVGGRSFIVKRGQIITTTSFLYCSRSILFLSKCVILPVFC